jgi:hypothetical protein
MQTLQMPMWPWTQKTSRKLALPMVFFVTINYHRAYLFKVSMQQMVTSSTMTPYAWTISAFPIVSLCHSDTK